MSPSSRFAVIFAGVVLLFSGPTLATVQTKRLFFGCTQNLNEGQKLPPIWLKPANRSLDLPEIAKAIDETRQNNNFTINHSTVRESGLELAQALPFLNDGLILSRVGEKIAAIVSAYQDTWVIAYPSLVYGNPAALDVLARRDFGFENGELLQGSLFGLDHEISHAIIFFSDAIRTWGSWSIRKDDQGFSLGRNSPEETAEKKIEIRKSIAEYFDTFKETELVESFRNQDFLKDDFFLNIDEARFEGILKEALLFSIEKAQTLNNKGELPVQLYDPSFSLDLENFSEFVENREPQQYMAVEYIDEVIKALAPIRDWRFRVYLVHLSKIYCSQGLFRKGVQIYLPAQVLDPFSSLLATYAPNIPIIEKPPLK